MKKLKLTLLILILGLTQVFGQRSAESRHAKHLEKLDSIVGLTEEQKIQVTALSKEHVTEMRELKENAPKVDHSKIVEMRKEHKQAVENVLTNEQKQKLDDHKSEMKENRKAARDEVKAYREENMKPVLDRYKAQMRESLSQTELEQLTSARDKIKAIKASEKVDKTEGEGERGQKGKGKAKLSDESRAKIKTIMETEVAPIAKAHETEITKMNEDLKPLKDTWKADIEAIKAKHGVEGKMGKKHHKMKKGKKGKKCAEGEKCDKAKCDKDCSKNGKGKKRGEKRGEKHMEKMTNKFLLSVPE